MYFTLTLWHTYEFICQNIRVGAKKARTPYWLSVTEFCKMQYFPAMQDANACLYTYFEKWKLGTTRRMSFPTATFAGHIDPDTPLRTDFFTILYNNDFRAL